MKKSVILLASALAVTLVLFVGCGTPHMALYDVTGAKTAINPGDTVDFGTAYNLNPPHSQTRNFRVENTGTGDLQLTGSGNKVVVSGADPGFFTIPTQPPDKIPAGGSADFDIVFTATTAFGQKNATVGIASDASDLSSLSFNVTGNDQQS